MKIFITMAPTGAEASKSDNPNIPLQPAEIVEQAIASEAAGASMIHIHGRDLEGVSTMDTAVLEEIMGGVREYTDLVVQLSTGGSVDDSFENRLSVLELAPESCSITLGSVNFGDKIFKNPRWLIKELYETTLDKNIVPEFECFDLGHVEELHRLLDECGPPAGGVVHCNIVLGVNGGIAGTPENLVSAVGKLPPDASWSSTGIGRSHVPIILSTLALGGNLRVGMEDVLRFSRKEMVANNQQLVSRAAEIARLAGFGLMEPNEVRESLGVRARSR